MKRFSLLIGAALLSLAAMAEGYQVNLQSTKQSGMAHTGAALKLGAESMHFNPAGLGFMDKALDLSAGVSGVISTVTWENGGKMASTSNPISTPMYLYAGFKIVGGLNAGISVTNPYGSTMDWGKNWAGAALVQDIALKSFSIQPTLAYKVGDKLSIGAGAMIFLGDFSLSRALIPAGGLESLRPLGQVVPSVNPILDALKDLPAASTTLSGDAKPRVGFNVGVMYDLNDQWTVGVSYRSKVAMHVNEGNAVLDYASKEKIDQLNQILTQVGKGKLPIPEFDKATFSAELPLPSNLNVGVSFKPDSRWLITAEGQYVGWGAYEELAVNFDRPVFPDGSSSLKAAKNYSNTIIIRAGAQFAAIDRLDLRFGMYFDQSPVKDKYLNPETPSMNKLGTTAGMSFRPIDRLSIDFAVSYVTGFGREGSYPLTSQPTPVFSGHYTASAFTPSLGVSYGF